MIRRPPESTLTTHSCPTRRSSDLLEAFLASSQATVNGEVVLETHGGIVNAVAIDSKHILNAKGATYAQAADRSEEHTSELQSLMRSSYAVFCLKNTNQLDYRLLLEHTNT